MDVLQMLVDGGDTVVVIEHNLDVIKTADYLIDLGPEGGDGGGTVVATGTPEDICKVPASYTGQFLKPVLERTRAFMEQGEGGKSWLSVKPYARKYRTCPANPGLSVEGREGEDHLRRQGRQPSQPRDQLHPPRRQPLAEGRGHDQPRRDLETIVVATEMEALILENNLIKKHHPATTSCSATTRLSLYQGHRPRGLSADLHDPPRQPRRARYFGPFADSTAVHRVLKLMQRAYHIRSCRVMPSDRPCLQYHLHHCDAPCVHYITKADYNANVDQAVAVLEGRDNGVVRSLQEKMAEAAEAMEFEKAAMYRDQLKAVAVIQEQQNIVNTDGGDMDVIGLARQAGQTCVQIYTVRMGKLMGRETFSLDNSSDGRRRGPDERRPRPVLQRRHLCPDGSRRPGH